MLGKERVTLQAISISRLAVSLPKLQVRLSSGLEFLFSAVMVEEAATSMLVLGLPMAAPQAPVGEARGQHLTGFPRWLELACLKKLGKQACVLSYTDATTHTTLRTPSSRRSCRIQADGFVELALGWSSSLAA